MTTAVVGWVSRSHWNPELPIFNQLDEQESKQQRELQIITLMDRPYGGYSSPTLPCEWVQGQPPFNVFLISTDHSYSSIANCQFCYGDDPDRPIPSRHTQDENCPLQPCCHQRHCILRSTTLASQHGDDFCCADCLGSSITRQPIASTQCGSIPDQTIVCRTHIHLQTGGPESNPHSVNMGSVESETITRKAGSTTQAQGNPPPAKKKKHSRTKTHQTEAERISKYHCDQPDCPYQTDWSTNLKQHKKTHQPKAERTYKYHCDRLDCPYQTDRSDHLKQHKKTHQARAERTYKYHCDQPDCPYQTDQSTNLEKHKKTHQPKAERTCKYHCDQPDCSYQNDRHADLELHKKTHQARTERTYKYHCDQPDCPYQADWSSNLEQHKKTHQARAERTYKYHCDQPGCPFQTDLSAHLERHKKRHQANREKD